MVMKNDSYTFLRRKKRKGSNSRYVSDGCGLKSSPVVLYVAEEAVL